MPKTVENTFSRKLIYKQPPPKVKDNCDRFYLIESEVMELVEAARKDKRHGNRNGTLILMMFRHGLRTIEAINLKWSQIDFKTGHIFHIFVQRAKNGKDSTQPLRGKEIRGLRQLQREYPDGNYVFQTERKTPLSARMVRQIIENSGKDSVNVIKPRPHLLRHSCGFHLAQKGIDTRAIQDYLGHKNIHHTVRYT